MSGKLPEQSSPLHRQMRKRSLSHACLKRRNSTMSLGSDHGSNGGSSPLLTKENDIELFEIQRDHLKERREKTRMKIQHLERNVEDLNKVYDQEKSKMRRKLAGINQQISKLNLSKESEIKKKSVLRRQKSKIQQSMEELKEEFTEESKLMEERLQHLQQKNIDTVQQFDVLNKSLGQMQLSMKVVEQATAQAPVGLVCIVFTDIQGSSKFWDTDVKATTKAIKLHNDLMRKCIAENSGYVVKTEGDSFMVAFQNVVDAISFGVDVERKLMDLTWPKSLLEMENGKDELNDDGVVIFRGFRVRIGMDFGKVMAIRDPDNQRLDYFGNVCNKASRIESLAPPGTIAISESCYRELKSAIAKNASTSFVVKDFGKQKLKGISEPENVWIILPNGLEDRINSKKPLSQDQKQYSKLKQEFSKLKESLSKTKDKLKLARKEKEEQEERFAKEKKEVFSRLRKQVEQLKEYKTGAETKISLLEKKNANLKNKLNTALREKQVNLIRDYKNSQSPNKLSVLNLGTDFQGHSANYVVGHQEHINLLESEYPEIPVEEIKETLESVSNRLRANLEKEPQIQGFKHPSRLSHHVVSTLPSIDTFSNSLNATQSTQPDFFVEAKTVPKSSTFPAAAAARRNSNLRVFVTDPKREVKHTVIQSPQKLHKGLIKDVCRTTMNPSHLRRHTAELVKLVSKANFSPSNDFRPFY